MNTLFKKRNIIRFDLLKKGFWDSYKVWYCHGEPYTSSRATLHECNDQSEDNSCKDDNINENLHNAYGIPDVKQQANDSTQILNGPITRARARRIKAGLEQDKNI